MMDARRGIRQLVETGRGQQALQFLAVEAQVEDVGHVRRVERAVFPVEVGERHLSARAEFNLSGQKTLRNYSRPVNLKRFDPIGWMTSQEDVWAIPAYLVEIPHTPILTSEQERSLSRMDKRLMAAGQVGTVK